MSNFWTKERDRSGWTVVAGGAFYVALALADLAIQLHFSAAGEWAAVGRKLRIGPVGNYLISGIVVAALSWLLMLGLQAIRQRKSLGMRIAGPMPAIVFLGNPHKLASDPAPDIWAIVAISITAGVFLTFCMNWLEKPSQPKTND